MIGLIVFFCILFVQFDYKVCSVVVGCLHAQLSPMRFDNIISNTQPETGTFVSLFGGEERLQDFVFDVVGDTGAVVGDTDFYFTPPRDCGDL